MNASAMSARRAETGTGSGRQPASAIGKAETPETTQPLQNKD